MQPDKTDKPTGYRKFAHIIGGGTVYHIRSHLALAAPAYGATARHIFELCRGKELAADLWLTRMAGGASLETPTDIAGLTAFLTEQPETKIIFFNPAMADYTGYVADDIHTLSGKYATRLSSRAGNRSLNLSPAPKIIAGIRAKRKDIFLVGFKTTCGATPQQQYLAGLALLKEASCNLVLANDTKTRRNMIITPEEARYMETNDRDAALKELVDMAYLRSHLTFTRATVVAGEAVPWDDPTVPSALRTVVDFCIDHSAYKAFNGATVGHFATKIGPKTFLTSRRKTNFNDLRTLGLVKVETDGPDSVIAYGAKPSVGGQSQRIVFDEHPEYDCIVHFHCPAWESSKVPRVSQREYECGSHECGQNTSRGLKKFGNLSAVMLENHGPNIVFNRGIDPAEVIRFIEDNFDLASKTGGPVAP